MKSKNIVLAVLLVAIVGIVSYIAVNGFPQTAIANFPTQSGCVDYQKTKYCAGGYSCTPCSKVTLPYTLSFSSGNTNVVYTADCVRGTTNTANGHTACQDSSAITSHVGYWCVSGNLHWFNSVGKDEGVKTTCQYGCTDIHKGGTTKSSCDAKPVTLTTTPVTTTTVTTPTQKTTTTSTTAPECMPNTNNLCTKPATIGGYLYCDIDSTIYCAGGCSNGACKTTSCPTQSKCPQNNYIECSSSVSFHRCSVQSNSCLDWGSDYFCKSTEECKAGSCVAKPVTTTVSQPTQTTTTTSSCPTTVIDPHCLDSTSLEYKTKTMCSPKTFVCLDGATCVDGSCKTKTTVSTETAGVTTVGIVDGTPKTDLCVNVVCPDGCDAQNTRNTGGQCNPENGQCVYSNSVVASLDCLPTPPAENVSTEGTGAVVEVPDRTQTSWFQKYGIYGGIAVVLFLIAVYINLDVKSKKRGGRK